MRLAVAMTIVFSMPVMVALSQESPAEEVPEPEIRRYITLLDALEDAQVIRIRPVRPCSIALQAIPVPDDRDFTLPRVSPRGEGIIRQVRPPAPPCGAPGADLRSLAPEPPPPPPPPETDERPE